MAEIKARFPIVLVGFLLLTIVISACAPPITEASAMDPVDAQKEEQTTSIDEPKKAPESDKPEENDKKVEMRPSVYLNKKPRMRHLNWVTM